MGLRRGWRLNETRKTVWREDSALGEVPAEVIDRWSDDPDASHLLPFAKPGETPEVFTFRTLTADEVAYCRAATSPADAYKGGRAFLRAFRIAVRFPDGPKKITDSRGVVHDDLVELVDGFYMLSEGYVDSIVYEYDSIAGFYGSRILNMSILSDAEKKASSPPSTPTPSQGAPQAPTANGSMKGDTAALAVLDEAAA